MKKTYFTILILAITLGTMYSCEQNDIRENDMLYKNSIDKSEIKRPGNGGNNNGNNGS